MENVFARDTSPLGVDAHCPVEKGGASQENMTGKGFRNTFWREEMKKLWNQRAHMG